MLKKKPQIVWVVEYTHKHGLDVSVCATEKLADAVACGLMQEFIDEFDGWCGDVHGELLLLHCGEGPETAKKRKCALKRALKTGDADKAIEIWPEWTGYQENINILNKEVIR